MPSTSGPIPPVETVNSITKMEKVLVTHAGTGSKIHISAAIMNMASIRCSVTTNSVPNMLNGSSHITMAGMRQAASLIKFDLLIIDDSFRLTKLQTFSFVYTDVYL